MPTTSNTELLVTLHNVRKPLRNIKKSYPSDAVRATPSPNKPTWIHFGKINALRT